MSVRIPTFEEILAVSHSRGGMSYAPGLWKGLVGAWPLQEPGGLTAFDASGYGKHGTLTLMDPATDRVVTEKGRALDFDGSNDYISGPAWGLLPSIVSISTWWRSGGDYTTNQALCANATTDSYSSGVLTFAYNANKIEWWQSDADPTLTSTLSISSDAWRHVVVRRKGATGAWNIDLFIDGVLDKTYSGAADPRTTAGQRFCLGRFGDFAGYYLNGRLTNALVYNRFLAETEIAQLYADPWAMYRQRRRVFAAAVAAPPGGLSIPIAMHHYKQLMGVN